jgi:DNA-directed RNA polymerase III subunit RPC2
MLFWSGIVASIYLLGDIDNLQNTFGFLRNVPEYYLTTLAGILPVWILNLLLSMLPAIIGSISTNIERRKTSSDVQMQIYNWFFFYTVINVYVMVLSGSVINDIVEGFKNSFVTLQRIGQSIPVANVYFINFTIAEVFLSLPLMMLRLDVLIWRKIYIWWYGRTGITRRTYIDMLESSINLGYLLPYLTFFVMVGVLYWVMAPLLTVLMALCFGAYYVVIKYQYMYVVIRQYESRGSFWYSIYDRCMGSLVVSTVAMIIFLYMKVGNAGATMTVPLLIYVSLKWTGIKNKYERVALNVPFSLAVDIDRDIELRKGDSGS